MVKETHKDDGAELAVLLDANGAGTGWLRLWRSGELSVIRSGASGAPYRAMVSPTGFEPVLLP